MLYSLKVCFLGMLYSLKVCLKDYSNTCKMCWCISRSFFWDFCQYLLPSSTLLSH